MFKSFFKLFTVLILTALISCQQDLTEQNPVDVTDEILYMDLNNTEPGWVRIKFREGFPDLQPHINARGMVESGISEMDRIAAEVGATEIKRVFRDGGRFRQRREQAGLHLWYEIYFDQTVPVTRAITDFNSLPEIEKVEPVYRYRINNRDNIRLRVLDSETVSARTGDAPFNDPYLSRQWHYYNTGEMGDDFLPGSDINLFAAWEKYTGSDQIIIAVIDGGVEYYHADLADAMWVNPGESAGTGTDDDGNGYEDDVHGWNFVTDTPNIVPHFHGTHVAGTIGAVNGNGIGVCGVAGGDGVSKGVRIMTCQVFQTHPQYPWWDMNGGFEEAFVYAADNGAVIAQCSWSGDLSDVINDAMNYFIDNAGYDENGNQVGPMAGGIIIAAAGNDDTSDKRMAYPAAWEGTLSVGAVDYRYSKPGYSNYGDWVDLSATGGSLTDGAAGGVLSTLLDGQYGYLDGTSMACPHVSGIAALVIQKLGLGGGRLTPARLREILIRATKSVNEHNPDYIDMLGVGMIDAAYALADDRGVAPDPVSELQVKTNSHTASATLTWEVSADQNGLGVNQFWLLVSNYDLDGIDLSNIPADIDKRVIYSCEPLGGTRQHTIEDLAEGINYRFGIAAVDIFGNVSDLSVVKGRIYNGENNPPVVSGSISDITLNGVGEIYGTEIDLDKYFTDPDYGDELSYSFTSTAPDYIHASLSGPVFRVYGIRPGYSHFTVVAADLEGETVMQQFQVRAGQVSSAAIELYPNPVLAVMTMSASNYPGHTLHLLIRNSSGQKVYENEFTLNGSGKASVDLSALSSGTYTAVATVGGQSVTTRIMKR